MSGQNWKSEKMYSKRDLEKERHRREQEETALVFQDFIETFHETATTSKTFVRSGILHGDKTQTTSDNQLYQPFSKIKSSYTIQSAMECAKILKDDPLGLKKLKGKSNLELLKEELKQKHLEKIERTREETCATDQSSAVEKDSQTTNIFVSNLKKDLKEADLMMEFGAFGPLASIKIMWPRDQDKVKFPYANCGFVAFMSRQDAERAMEYMTTRSDMRLDWGKSVEIPPHPIYIPKNLLSYHLPPPQSGLPFNCQPTSANKMDSVDIDDMDLSTTVVKVTIPMNKTVLNTVHRMVQFVVNEGPLFEAMIMNKEISNPEYTFLFDNRSPTHVYYSVLQGDDRIDWSMKPFRMFQGGSIWTPPQPLNFKRGMPKELVHKAIISHLSDNQCVRLIEMIRSLNMSRQSICEAMVFCIDHVKSIRDAIDIIVDSLLNGSMDPVKKVARVYLFSDVLSNCTSNQLDQQLVQDKLRNIIEHLKQVFLSINKDCDKISFACRLTHVLKHLESLVFFQEPLGINMFDEYFSMQQNEENNGNSSSDEDYQPLDGASLLKRSMENESNECVITADKIAIFKRRSLNTPIDIFVPSKWDTLEREEVEAQAVSSSDVFCLEVADKENRNKKRKSDSVEEKSFTPKQSSNNNSDDNMDDVYRYKHKAKRSRHRSSRS